VEQHLGPEHSGLKNRDPATHSIFVHHRERVTKVSETKEINLNVVSVTLRLLYKAAYCFVPYVFVPKRRTMRPRWPIG
jgi:hypothetical protein